MLEECRGKWRVVLDPDVERFFEERGLREELEEWRRELEEGLNRDPGEIMRLLREPVIGGAGPLKARRYRLYMRGQGYRLVFAVNTRLCMVYFMAAEKRDEETYRRLRRRLRG